MKTYDGGASLIAIFALAAAIGWGVNKGADAIAGDTPTAAPQQVVCKAWVTEPLVGAGLEGKTKSTCVDDERVS